MATDECYEGYPLSTVAVANIHTASMYAAGVLILSGFGLTIASLYAVYCLLMVLSVLRRSCVNCYYFGKTCFSGWGRLSSRVFKKGDTQAFIKRRVTWLSILPDILVVLLPVAGGLVLLTTAFAWTVVGAIVVLLFLWIYGNGVVRGRLACKHCKQRTIGCPAERLFEKRPGEGG